MTSTGTTPAVASPPQVEPTFDTLFANSQKRLHASSVVPILRSSQLDATRLDEELEHLLQHQLGKATAYMKPGTRLKVQPEMTAVVSVLLLGLSLWRSNSTPGAAMMNLQYRDERTVLRQTRTGVPAVGRTGVEGPPPSVRQRWLLTLGCVLLPWAWQRILGSMARSGWHYQASGGWRHTAAWFAVKVEGSFRVAMFVNFLLFLRGGIYRTLLERVLGMRLVYVRPVMARAMSFDYLNRQLVWAQVSELFLFALPLLDSAGLKRLLALPQGWRELQARQDGGSPAAGCQVCGRSEASNPFRAQPCSHVFCYYCIRSHTESDPTYVCPTCQVRVQAITTL